MTVSLKHTTQATGSDAGNGEIRKSQWNEEHNLTGSANTLLGFGGSGLPVEFPRHTITVPGSDSSVVVSDTGSDGAITLTTDNVVRALFNAYGATLQALKVSKQVEETVYAPSAGSAFTVDLANGTIHVYTTNANVTVTLPSAVQGRSYLVAVYYGGSHTVTWAGGGTLKWAGGSAPAASSTSGKYDLFSFVCPDNSVTWAQQIGKGY